MWYALVGIAVFIVGGFLGLLGGFLWLQNEMRKGVDGE